MEEIKETEETISIKTSEHKRLLNIDMFMNALNAAGVSDWEGYEYACEIFEQWVNEKK